MHAIIKAIEYYLPEQVLTNSQLASEFPEWSVGKIELKVGINQRHIAAPEECSSDLGVKAAQKLFDSGICSPENIDYILLCTQSPDYFLPTTACIMQDRLGIPTSAGAMDFNLGCSGFVYGLGLAKGLIETGQARNLLLITAETYSKFIEPTDKSVRVLFGDAAAATLVQLEDDEVNLAPGIGPFVFGTDGRGAENLIVKKGGLRHNYESESNSELNSEASQSTNEMLYMNGPEIFNFTLRVVPDSVRELLLKAEKQFEDIDLFVFHQANQYMLEHLRKKLNIPANKFYIAMRDCGNTVSATIPIALKEAANAGKLRKGDQVMLVGFGVGYSWSAALIRWIGTIN